ncbi:CusA/CzcA family heavy metal efflux RND transporter [Mucilaginibacter rubeus]|uniref:CusA/CzcA family heavy metal efflux RND transporter n=2 Tax=Mucilaginibacter rubeus TaxID=2027860 RepID=A0A364WYW6_9SPHI|nr:MULTISPECIES: CusA/CzcA family heavy metal efflux RND transporter [Mucilaginibacter]QEM06115.1 CusA/CzcA family heavy metal efflux RND transporter [Mucilaginibacter rubeus]QEM13632.1 CusA/CzcA family heavy metal efflux RND transporter [Mucilaginibacter rubeus]QEM18695.1 CusA/CzcA family heavy metal efflux RND transporter [Mucilaginibacter gossypii]QTE36310.1 CusA/CzcA family heavy metal efflux RND transporter [Mucilaginibacter gossypii]QTE44763.1 CusA/CzcA family heavy metal efflux RND tran
MLNKIIEFSVRNKLIVGLFIFGLICFGIYEVKRLPIDAVPDITDNQVQIITRAPALGAPDVERFISFPIEQSCRNIPDVKKIRSFSRFGLSVVTIVFDEKAEIYWARQQVSERLNDIASQIPTAYGKPEMAPVTTGLGEIYQYSVRAKAGYEKKYDAMALRTIQDWIVRKQLLGLPGVADVSSFGGYLKQYQISVDPARLKANNISIGEVFTALQKNNNNTGGAYIERGPTVLFIRSEGLVSSLEDIGNIVVKNLPNGTPLLIRDIGEVGLDHATRYGAMTWNGQQEVSGAVVMMLKGANSNEVIKNIKDKVVQIQKTLPQGVVIDAFLDRTKMVDNAIGTVEHNLLEGIAIVLIVLIIFLGNFRAALIVASVIPLAMLIAVILMNLFGVSGNLMSLGALDFGLIVDGTVIIVEAIMHEIHLKKRAAVSHEEMDNDVISVSARMRNAAIFGELIILIVYIPIFTLQGIEGKMFKPMAQTVAFALIGAFILSLTYVPVISSLSLSRKQKNTMNWSDQMMNFFQRHYHYALVRVVKHPKMTIGIAAIAFIVSVFVLTRLGGEFIPKLEEGDFAVETRVLTGSGLQTSVQAIKQGSKILLSKFPEVEQVVGKTGSSEIPTDPMPIEASDMMVILKDKSKWTNAKSFDELTEKMSKELEAVPGVTFGFQYPVQMRFNELMTGARQDVVCKIFGENLDTLAIFAKKLGTIAGGIKGARDIYVEAVTGMPQIVIRYKRAAIAEYGLNVEDINRVVNTAFAGQSSGTVYEGEKRFDLVVRLAGEQRKQLSDVQDMLIPTPTGSQVPLQQVADVKIEEGPNQIQREDAQRRIIVGFNVLGRDVQSIVEELQQKVNNQIKLPPGYYTTYGGAFENLNAAKQRLMIAVPVSLLLIFLMLYFAFGSMRQGLLIFSAVPLSAIGGVIALVIRGMPFSISAGVGFIALFGVAVLNGLVLISEFNRLRKDGWDNLRNIVFEGTKLRLRPVLMTAAVASLGFLPMALSNGAGAEVQRPLATVVIGGLITATFLTLFVLPILYILFEKGKSMKIPVKSAVIVLLTSLGLFAGSTKAQTPISLKAAIDTAFKNNLNLKSERLNADYLKRITGTGVTIPKTNITGEYGQINSAYNDNRLSVVQSVNFPTVYTRQKALLHAEYQAGELNVNVRKKELERQVTESFYNILYLKQKLSLLLSADSTYALFVKNANLRFDKGESNILEKTTAETQRGQIARQTEMVNADLLIADDRFRVLLNTASDYQPEARELKLPLPLATDTAFSNHPQVLLLGQQQQVSKAQTALERSKLLPDLNMGYYNQSFNGIQTVNGINRTYDGSNRFSSVQLGVSVPLFFGAQKNKISASRIKEQQAQIDYLSGLQALQNRYKQAAAEVVKYQKLTAYYEKTGLPNATLILKTANLQFTAGQVNYLEYTLLINQATALRSEYTDAVNNLNQAIIQINALQNRTNETSN